MKITKVEPFQITLGEGAGSSKSAFVRSLPAEVYANLDFEKVVNDIAAAAGPGSYRGYWQGPRETAIYFFGPSAEYMFERVEPLLLELPIGQNARVVIRHGKPSLSPREVRMPRR